MDQLRLGRYSLLFTAIGLAAIATTFVFPAIFVLFSIFGVTTFLLGLLGVRTRAGRIGLFGALITLPILTCLTHHFGFDARVHKKPAPAPRSAKVHFSPNGGCTEAILSEVARAKSSVLVQAYWFTSPPVAQALVAAHERGVTVQVLLDKSQDTGKYSVATYLYNHDIIPWIDNAHAIAHNKVLIIDNQVVITGSMNLTKSAETRNAENILILDDSRLATAYTANWNAHQAHSYSYNPPVR